MEECQVLTPDTAAITYCNIYLVKNPLHQLLDRQTLSKCVLYIEYLYICIEKSIGDVFCLQLYNIGIGVVGEGGMGACTYYVINLCPILPPPPA